MYNPLHCHTFFSLLDGLTSPSNLIRRAIQVGATAVASTDHGSVSSLPQVFRAAKNACKHCGYQRETHSDGGKGKSLQKGVACPGFEPATIKAIAGSEFYLCRDNPTVKTPENRSLAHLVVLAKNRAGWDALIRATSAANAKDHHWYKPRLDLETLAGFSGGNWVTFSGHPGSQLADVIFTDAKQGYRGRTEEDVRKHLKEDSVLKEDLRALASKYQTLFGKENFWVEVQLIDRDKFPAAAVVAAWMRWVAADLSIPCLATPDAHYPERKDAVDQLILLCSSLNTTLRKVEARLRAEEDVQLGGFFRSDSYHIPTADEMRAVGHTEEELRQTLIISELCSEYAIDRNPMLPKFPCPGGVSEGDYVRQLCREGWKTKIQGRVPTARHGEYVARVKEELAMFDEVGLHGYFLVVWDMIQYATNELGCLPPVGRGSCAGTMVGYLMGIHSCDPIDGKLLLSRFFNKGRVKPGKITLPDIDTDVPVDAREPIIAYLKKRWGEANVGHIATFGTLQGREALTQVLKAHDFGDYAERKAITNRLPSEAAISDKLQEMKENDGTASIIRYALETFPDDFAEYCRLDDEDNFSGPLGPLFEQASRLEGCKRSRGKHASGIAITPLPLGEFAPLVYDTKSEECLVGFEYEDAEGSGIPKIDLLGLAVYDKCQDVIRYLAGER